MTSLAGKPIRPVARRLLAGRLLVLAIAVACSNGVEPKASGLLPNAIGTEWHYLTRDTLISGDVLAPVILRDVVRHRADTTLLGARWMVLAQGGLIALGQLHEDLLLRDSPSGLARFIPGNLIRPPGELLFIPSRLGEASTFWTLAAMEDTIQTPAGRFVARRFVKESPVVGSPAREMWVSPGTGVVRILYGGATTTDVATGKQRVTRMITELEMLGRP